MDGTAVVFKGWMDGVSRTRVPEVVDELIGVVIANGYGTFHVLMGQEVFGWGRWRVTVIVRKEDTIAESVGRVGYEVERRVDDGSWDMREVVSGDWESAREAFSEWSVLFDSWKGDRFTVHYFAGEEFREEWDGKMDVATLFLLDAALQRWRDASGQSGDEGGRLRLGVW